MLQFGRSYIRDSGHFLEKIKISGCTSDNLILVTSDVVGSYPNIPCQAGLIALKEALDKKHSKNIPTNDWSSWYNLS